jgi:hypothetical protein
MRQTLHIFKKDVRRLWWAAAATLLILAELAKYDCWRSDWMAGVAEGWLNILLPLAWAALIGLTVEQDPIPGDRQFWITRPYSRGALLSAKILFALAFVHVPSFLADCVVLAARGFQPAAALGALLSKQVTLAAALTIPALALASLVRNFTQFMLALLSVAGAMVVLSGSAHPQNGPQRPFDTVLVGILVLTVATAAAAVAVLQFIGRRTAISRSISFSAAVLAAAMFVWLPPSFTWTVRSRMASSHPDLAMRIDEVSSQGLNSHIWPAANRAVIAIPVSVSGAPPDERYHLQPLGLTVESAAGKRYRAFDPYRDSPSDKIPLDSYVSREEPNGTQYWLVIRASTTAYNEMKDRPVTISGEMQASLTRLGASVVLPALANGANVGAMRCYGTQNENRWSEGSLKFECESPYDIPDWIWTSLSLPGVPQQWTNRMFYGTYSSSPRPTWLSPLNRHESSFALAAHWTNAPGEQWRAPMDALDSGHVTLTRELPVGYSLLRYELKNVRLQDYERKLGAR